VSSRRRRCDSLDLVAFTCRLGRNRRRFLPKRARNSSVRDTGAVTRCRASVEVLDDLVRARPLRGRDDKVDVATAEPVERVIGCAFRVEAHAAELVAPRQRRRLLLEGGDGLPVRHSRGPDQHHRLPRGAALWKPRDRHTWSLRLAATAPRYSAAPSPQTPAPTPITSDPPKNTCRSFVGVSCGSVIYEYTPYSLVKST